MDIKRKGTGYYDGFDGIAIEELVLKDGAMLDEVFYLKDLTQRKLFLNGPVTQDTVLDTVRHIMQFNREDAGIPPHLRRPILLYLCSRGGEEEPGYMLIDAILNSTTPVYTINLGLWYSMGFLIGLAGHKRFATKHARFLMHDGSSMVMESASKMQDIVEFQRKADERTKQYVLEHSKLTSEEYDAKTRVEWYLFADEAREMGFIDAIIGEDCPLEEII